MQRLLLPRSMPVDEHITFAAHYRTSLHAGGDYYDVLPLGDGRYAIVVADVAGHGAGAAIVMSMIRTVLHSTTAALDQPGDVLGRINDHFAYLVDSHLFATAVYAVIDPRRRMLRIARAGHLPPMLLRSGMCVAQWKTEGTLPLFIDALPNIPVVEHALEPGDRLLFFTDGVTDVVNPDGARFELSHLAEAMMRYPDLPAHDQLDRMVGEIDDFAHGQEPIDDITLLLAALT